MTTDAGKPCSRGAFCYANCDCHIAAQKRIAELEKESPILKLNRDWKRLFEENLRLKEEVERLRYFLGDACKALERAFHYVNGKPQDGQDINFAWERIYRALNPAPEERCKHGVWKADHCFKCAEERNENA